MQDNAFKAALSAEGQAASSVSTRLSDARRIEEHFGNLDAAFDQDGCAAIMQALTYTASDQAAGRPNPSGMPIEGNLYDSLRSYRAALSAYIRFLNASQTNGDESQADRIRQFVASHYADGARREGREGFTVISGQVHRDMDLHNAMPAVCSALGSKKLTVLIAAELAEREGPPASSTVKFTFAFHANGNFDIAAAERELRRRYGDPIPTIKPEGNQKIISFALPDERQIALELEGKSVRLWVEDNAGAPPPPCEKFDTYLPSQGRQANLPSRLRNNPPGDMQARRVIKAVIPQLTTLTAVLDWYEAINEDIMQLTREAVIEAMAECDALGLQQFLTTHDFRNPNSYWVKEKGRHYPAKAIANVGLRAISGPSTKIVDATRSRDMLTRLGFLVIDRNAQEDTTPSDEPLLPEKQLSQTTNLILYGPPGTGKTFATAWEAVRLCLGDATAAHLRHDRDGLMAEYRRLAGEGQIDFVTFHQSFSYEDFVEGLRPTTRTEVEGDQEQDVTASGGFSLKPHAGVFKLISERARLDTGDAPTHRLDRSRSIYKIALGQRGNQEDRIKEGLDGALIHLGWGGDIDWSNERFDDFEEIRKEWNEKKDPDASGKDPNIEMTYAFRSGLQIDDYVVISDGRDSYRAFGQVTGEYRFDPDASFHPHRRSVKWIWRDDEGAERRAFYPRNFRRQSAYRLDPDEIDWDALETVVIGPNAERPVAGARPHVLVIDEINRANISRVFGELITLLEVDKRLGCENEVRVRLPYSGTSFGVPSNLHIIATMNTADRSIALLDTALRRRFTFRELMPDTEALRGALAAKQIDANNVDGIDLCKLMRTINERIEYLFDREHQIGHAYFTGCHRRADVEDVMRHKVIPLLAEYFYEDWSKVAAVLGDSDGAAGARFIEAKRLSAPAGFAEDEFGGDKLRWSVKASFDFSEFEI